MELSGPPILLPTLTIARAFTTLLAGRKKVSDTFLVDKRAGSRQSGKDPSAISQKLCALVYTIAIAAAGVRHAERITRASNEACRRRVSSLLRLNWLDRSTRDLLRAWRNLL